MTDVKKALEKNDAGAIKGALERLTAAQHKLAETLYQQTAPGGGGGQGPGRTRARRPAARHRKTTSSTPKWSTTGRSSAAETDESWTSTNCSACRATQVLDDIKRAYRRLARRYHPDINPGDRAAAVRFRAVADAYEMLADPERRRQYDASADGDRPRGDRDVRLRGVRLLGGVGERAVGVDLRRPVRRRDSRHAWAARPRPGGRRRPARVDRARLRGRGPRGRDGRDARPARRLRPVPRRGRGAGGREHVPGLPRRGDDPLAARPHGVRQGVRALRRHRPAAPRGLPGLRRRAASGVQPERCRSRSPRASPTAIACAWRGSAMPARAAAAPAIST